MSMLNGRAFTLPNMFRLLICLWTVLGLQPAAFAIFEGVISLLKIMSRRNSRVDGARIGAICDMVDDRRDLLDGSWMDSKGYGHVADGGDPCTLEYRLCKICLVISYLFPVVTCFSEFKIPEILTEAA